jgi:hypothetical protein
LGSGGQGVPPESIASPRSGKRWSENVQPGSAVARDPAEAAQVLRVARRSDQVMHRSDDRRVIALSAAAIYSGAGAVEAAV